MKNNRNTAWLSKDIRSLCYAFGYLTAAARGEIEPVLSRQRVAAWLKTRLTPEQVAAGVEAKLSRQVYNHLERLAVSMKQGKWQQFIPAERRL